MSAQGPEPDREAEARARRAGAAGPLVIAVPDDSLWICPGDDVRSGAERVAQAGSVPPFATRPPASRRRGRLAILASVPAALLLALGWISAPYLQLRDAALSAATAPSAVTGSVAVLLPVAVGTVPPAEAATVRPDRLTAFEPPLSTAAPLDPDDFVSDAAFAPAAGETVIASDASAEADPVAPVAALRKPQPRPVASRGQVRRVAAARPRRDARGESFFDVLARVLTP